MPLVKDPPLQLRNDFVHAEHITAPGPETLPKRGHKIIAVMPAYNAERTLASTLADIPAGSVDEIILVDDCSKDRTVEVARDMGLTVIEHTQNKGYGGTQQTCYKTALEHGADIIVMIHPDYQ